MSNSPEPRRPLRLSWIDFLVVAAASLTFGAVVLSHGHHPPGPPPEETIQAMAGELGVTAEDLHRVAKQLPPPRPVGADAERTEHNRLLAAALGVPATRLQAVLEKYAPPLRF